jgi:hypothetical protein
MPTLRGAIWRLAAADGIIPFAMKSTGKRRRVQHPAEVRKGAATPKTAPTTGPLEPPDQEFLDRATGTLPEIIAETDLETLNSALGFLFARLREARRRFDQEGDNGRGGAIAALAAFWRFVVLFKRPLAEGLQDPIIRLQDALFHLNHNLVSPIVKPIPRPGRAPSSDAHATIKGYAAAAVTRLMDTGLDRQAAHEAVAKLLARLGVHAERGSGRITANTIKNWCNEVSSDVSRHSIAAVASDRMFTDVDEQRFSSMTKEQAPRFVLESFARWVVSVFPEIKKLPKHPI